MQYLLTLIIVVKFILHIKISEITLLKYRQIADSCRQKDCTLSITQRFCQVQKTGHYS